VPAGGELTLAGGGVALDDRHVVLASRSLVGAQRIQGWARRRTRSRIPLLSIRATCSVPNPIDRYNLAQRDKLIADANGSVDLYIRADLPGKDQEANTLPAPRDKFTLVMRIYAPKETPPPILHGIWTPPPVKPVE
jgi:hypothetical protein